MKYFSSFPLDTYSIPKKTSVVTDILRRCSFVSEYKPYTDLYYNHTIHDGETPQSLALQYYDNVNYYWVILMFNEIHDMIHDWPMGINELQQYCDYKYDQNGVSVANEVYYYELNGVIVSEFKEYYPPVTWVPPAYTSGNPVTFYEYESEQNDSKRNIQILRPELLPEFVTQFEKKINV